MIPTARNRGKTQTTFAEEQAKAAADGAEKAAAKSKRKLDQCNSTSTSTIAGDNEDNVEMEVNGSKSTLRRSPRNRRRSLHLRNGENQGGENTLIGGVSAFQ